MVDGITQKTSSFSRIPLGKAGKLGGLAYAVATGGVGKAIDKATKKATGQAISRAAQRASESYKKRQGGKQKASQARSEEDKKKMTGVGFWMIVGLALAKDLLDILTGLTVVLIILVVFTTMTISFIVAFYLFYVGVKPDTRKVVTWALSFLAEIVSGGFLPTYTISLFIIRFMENNGEFSALAGKLKKFKGFGRSKNKSLAPTPA